MNIVRVGMSQIGFGFAVEPTQSSCTLCCPTLPPGWSIERWMEANRIAGYALYACKGGLRNRFFQVSAMGETTSDPFDRWLEVVRGLLDL